MRICGVTITGSDANLAIVSPDNLGSVQYHPTATRKISLANEKSVDSLKAFGKSIAAFAHEHGVEAFCIKAREHTGLRSGGGISFKIETLIQLFGGKDVHFVHTKTLKKFSKSNHGGAPAGIVGYLEDPYRAGAYQLVELKKI